MPVAVYKNRNRDAINCAMFEEYCRKNKPRNSDEIFMGAVLVFMDELHMQDSAKTFVPKDANVKGLCLNAKTEISMLRNAKKC
jgi:hypothetical protein